MLNLTGGQSHRFINLLNPLHTVTGKTDSFLSPSIVILIVVAAMLMIMIFVLRQLHGISIGISRPDSLLLLLNLLLMIVALRLELPIKNMLHLSKEFKL